MPLPDQVALLCRAIREKGEAEARDILSQARQKAEAGVRRAKEESQHALETNLTQERRTAFHEAQRTRDAAELKARKLIMAAREAILTDIFEAGWQELVALREKPEYANVLRRLAVQAAAALPGEQCWLQVRAEDRSILPEKVLSAVGGEAGRRVELLPEPAPVGGGCLAYSGDRRSLVDLSFEALVRRAKPRLREVIAEALFGEGRPHA